jgi:hypothetical protein
VQAEISYKPRFKAIPPQEISLSEIFSWDEVTSYYDWLQTQFMDESQGSKLAMAVPTQAKYKTRCEKLP